MSIHRSLRGVNTLVGQRSVLTRVERIQQLAKDGKLDTEQASAFGLPKVRTKFKVTSAKKAEMLELQRIAEGGDPAEGPAAEESAE